MEFAGIRPYSTYIWESRIRPNSTHIRLNSTWQTVAGLGKKNGNFFVSNAMWDCFKSHSTDKMSKGLTMSKTLCAYDFMQMTSLIDRLCRMRMLKVCIRLEKSHSIFQKSHSTNINSNVIIEKKGSLHNRVIAFDLLKLACTILKSHSTFKMSNAKCNVAFDIWKVKCDILNSHSTYQFVEYDITNVRGYFSNRKIAMKLIESNAHKQNTHSTSLTSNASSQNRIRRSSVECDVMQMRQVIMLMTNCKPDRIRPRSDARTPWNDLAFFRRIRQVH